MLAVTYLLVCRELGLMETYGSSKSVKHMEPINSGTDEPIAA
jgi:hypothetical protein